MDLNSVSLTGRLAKDAETKLKGGMPLTEFTIAVGMAQKDENGEWVNGAYFFDVKLWGKQGEALNQYLRKGQMIALSGRLVQEKWEYDGKNYSKVLIVASNVTLCGGKKEQEPQTLQEARAAQNREESAAMDDFEDDIPF